MVQLLVMLAIALVMLLLSGIATAPIMLGGRSRLTMLAVQAVTQLLTFLVPVVIMTTIYYRGSEREYYRLEFGSRSWYYGFVGAVVMLLFVPLNDWLTVWNDSWSLGRIGDFLRGIQSSTEGLVEDMMDTDTIVGLACNLLVVALIPAICEEVFFRAGFQNLIQKWVKNRHLAIWLTAFVFSMAHGEVFSFMPRFVMGALLGYLYVYGGSLLTNVIAHFVNNALVVLLYWLVARGVLDIDLQAPLALDWVLSALCTMAGFAVLWVTFFYKNKDAQ